MANTPDGSARSTVNTRIVRVRDLPIYYDAKSEDIERFLPRNNENSLSSDNKTKSWLFTSISQTRQSVQQVWADNKELRERITRGIETGEAHTRATIDYIRDDETLLPKVGVVTVAGLGGLLLGHRGGPFRKTFYSSVAALVALSACYPKRTSTMMDQIYAEIQQRSNQLFNKTDQNLPLVKSSNENKDLVFHASKNPSQSAIEVKADYGQGTPADQHLYSTRGAPNESPTDTHKKM